MRPGEGRNRAGERKTDKMVIGKKEYEK